MQHCPYLRCPLTNIYFNRIGNGNENDYMYNQNQSKLE